MDAAPRKDLAIFRQNLGLRIAYAIDKIGSKSGTAAAAGISPEQLTKWVKGTVKVPIEALKDVADAAGIDFSWLATGYGAAPKDGPMQIRQTEFTATDVDHDQRNDADLAVTKGTQPEMIRLPIYSEVMASAGPGAEPVSELADGVISFEPLFLRNHGATPEKCVVIWARGDSMMPTIPNGAALVVDQSQSEISNGCIMVIGVGDDLLVKRIRRRLDGLIDLISDNMAYPPETLGPDALRQLRVVGRVIYFCRAP